VKKIGRFHVLTDICLQTQFSHLELAELAIAGGADTIQLREKGGETREMIRVAEQLQALCKRSGVTFIVNDRVDVAIASRADGVHLGQNDFPIPLARSLLGDLGHICEESGVGAELFKEKLPVSDDLRETALNLHQDPYDLFMGDSDDYELIITCRPQDVAPLHSVIAQCCPVLLTEVGRITGAAGKIMLLLPDGERRPVKRSGWDHFRLADNSKP